MATWTCRVLGGVFIAVGIWGFVTGSHVLMFHVNPLHNVVHLLAGVLALWAGFTSERMAKNFCWVFGTVYGLVALAGFLNVQLIVELLNLNRADDWLHLLLAIVLIAAAAAPVGGLNTLREQVGGQGSSNTTTHPTPMV